MDDDLALLEAWRRGDGRAGKQLFDRHYHAVARFFRSKVGDAWAELCQRTFLACLESIDSFRREGTFRGYLFGIAYRQLQRHFRAQLRERARFDLGTVSAVDLDPSPSRIVARREEERLLLAALRSIPIDYQVIVELHYWEGLTHRECAAALDLPLGTAKTRLRRARELLAARLEQLAEPGEVLTRTQSQLVDWVRSLRARLTEAC